MKHILISDTHSPICIHKAFEHVKNSFYSRTEADAIILNGDLLGVFSMRQSNVHKKRGLIDNHLDQYLQWCAPKFAEKYGRHAQFTSEMVLEYVQERYDWCVETILKFASVGKTYFNLGNHESKLHFLVLNELPFLTNCPQELIRSVDQNALEAIYDNFENQLNQLDQTNPNFVYIRNKHDIVGDTMILGIPGESHATTGPMMESQIQEAKTRQLLEAAKADLGKVKRIMLYVHTQGDYDRATGSHHTASPSLKQFMEELPDHITQRIYIQSHNHWSYTQFLKAHGFHFIINNAGLHDGIYNYIKCDENEVSCFDIDPNADKVIKLSCSLEQPVLRNDLELVQRNYPNFADIYMERRMLI